MANTPYLMGSFSAASGGTLTPTVTISTGNAAGDNVLVYVLQTAGASAPVVTDTQGQTYVMSLEKSPATACQLYCFECLGAAALVSGTDTLSVTFAATGAQAVLVVGDNGVNPQVDVLVGTSATTGTTASQASGVFPTAEEHVIAAVATVGTSTPSFTGAVSTSIGSTAVTGARLAAAYDIVAATTSVTASATVTSADWAIIVLSSPALTPTPTLSLSDGVASEAYSQTLEVTGGVAPYTWSITGGTLPTGLSLVSGVISGTPTVAGTYNFTTQVTDTHGVVGTLAQSITILASGAGGAPATIVPNNILTSADSDAETGSPTWAADTNASTPAMSTYTSLTGDGSISWKSLADGLTQISTGFYRCLPSTAYIGQSFLLPANMNDAFVGIKWYTSGGTLISTTLGPDNQTNSNIQWQPGYVLATSPSNAAKMKFTVQVAESNAGDMNHIDFSWVIQSKQAAVLIDWLNAPFGVGTIAGNDFMDVSPWVRMDQGINLTCGRQDSISEVTSGSATFTLQDDAGMFRRQLSSAVPYILGGDITLQRRCQVNLTDEVANWHVRFDGPLAEIDYQGDNTGNTDEASVSVADVLAPLSRQDDLSCWTVEQVQTIGPLYHWTLNDAGNAGGSGVAAETSGNNGPPMRVWNSDTSGTAVIAWQDSTGGVETQADAVSPGKRAGANGSEFWSAGTDQPNSPLRGLDSTVPGPYTTPLSSVNFTPILTSQTAANYFIGNTGYQLQAQLGPTQLLAPAAADGNHDYAIETWFTMGSASVSGTATQMNSATITGAHFGPFICLSLGSTRYKNVLVAGLFLTGGEPLTFEVATYNQPPAFLGQNWPGTAPPSVVQSVSSNMTADGFSLPHHLVLNIAGDPVAPTITAFVDGVNIGSLTLSAQQVFDTICVGGAFGGAGCWAGNISSCSVYNFQLSQSQVTTNAQMGQYGMWECPTDDCIAQLANYAQIPSFWNNLAANHNGLTLTEYQDITGTNALSNMQIFEDLEMGLIYVDAQGRMNFSTRDERMGKRGPDLLLPPDTFDANMGWETIDQFQCNEQAVSSQIFATGAGYINTASQDKYGVYAQNAIDSPVSLAIISWNRDFASLAPAATQAGLTSFSYWADPYMYDYSAWLANSRSDPWMIPGTLTIDLMSYDIPVGAPTISQYYALEIGDIIAPNGTLPGNFPNANLSMEWFIEGINETITQSTRTIQFYTSPAEPQRAWIPGDATYGVLDSTARIGISAPDTNATQSLGKSVSHDGGRPYWPPQFSSSGLQYINSNFNGGLGYWVNS